MTTNHRLRPILLAVGFALAADVQAAGAACGASTYTDRRGTLFLKVVGTTGKQAASIALGVSTTILSLDCNGDGDFADASLGDINAVDQGGVDGLDLQLGGSDTITINIPENYTTVAKTAKVVLGPGTNVLNVGSGTCSLNLDSRLLFDIQGGAGIDKPTLDFSALTINQSAISIRADLGAGSDVAAIKAPALGPRGVFSTDFAMGLGANTFTYTDGSGAPSSTERVDVQGDAGTDTVTLKFDHVSEALRLFTVDLGAGNDKLFANFDLASFSLLLDQPLHLTVNGGAGNDTISVGRNGTTGPAAAANVLELDLNGGAGNDLITVDFGSGAFSFSNVGGERLRVDGGAGVDTINVTLDSTTATTATHDISISGGAMADKIHFTQDTGGTGTHAWRGGAALADGSFGSPDVCTVAGTAAANAHKRNCEI